MLEIVELEKKTNPWVQKPNWGENHEQTIRHTIHHSDIPQHPLQLPVLQSDREGGKKFEVKVEGKWT